MVLLAVLAGLSAAGYCDLQHRSQLQSARIRALERQARALARTAAAYRSALAPLPEVQRETMALARALKADAGLGGQGRGHPPDRWDLHQAARVLRSLKEALPRLLAGAYERAHRPDRLPVTANVASGWGLRQSPWGGGSGREFHDGVDLPVPVGTAVLAAGDGVVTAAGWCGGYGYCVVVDHGRGVTSFYGHNSALLVRVGEQVRRGQVLARSGNSGRSTGPHVHFGIHVDGASVDPLAFLAARPGGAEGTEDQAQGVPWREAKAPRCPELGLRPRATRVARQEAQSS